MGKSSGGTTSKGPSFTKEQKGLLNQLINTISPQLGQGVESYEGPLVADSTEALNSIYSGTSGTAGDLVSGSGYFAPAAASGDVLQSLMKDFDPASTTDYWEKSIKAPAMDTWTKEILPQILESYGGRNASSSSGMGTALAKSGETLTTNLGAQLQELLFNTEQAQKQTQLSATGQAQNLASLPGTTLSQLLEPAGQEYNIEQALTTEPYTKWSTEQAYNNPWLQYLGGGALSTPGSASVSTTGGTSVWQSLLGAGTSLGTGYLMGK
ncbi:MAG: hypothetical protein RBT40_07390 [Petrimonas sp.]|jgi:hypothetical protein|nr:hypothetical protein [Petrimonas sp.]